MAFEVIKNKNLRIFVSLAIVLSLAAVVRLVFLNSVPGAVGGDELTYILIAKFMGLTGSDILGNWNPLSIFLFNYPSGFPQAELPYFLLYPAVNFFGATLVAIRVTYVIFSIGTVLLVYLFTKELLGQKVGLIAAALTAINPWQIFIGRTTYEVVLSTFFYLAAIFILLKVRGRNILFTIPLFLLAFYSYIGMKVALVPIVAIVSIYAYLLNHKKYAKEYIILNIAALMFVLFFLVSVSHGEQTRVGELFTPRLPEIANQVNDLRKNSVSGIPMTNLLDNKFIIYFQILFSKVLNIFSPDYLFFRSDDFVGIFRHGLFYFPDAIFLFLGAAFLFQKRKIFIFLSGLLGASALPQILFTSRTDVFSPHVALFVTFLIIPIAYGISRVLGDLKSKITLGLIISLYIIFFLNFVHIYFFEFPIQGHFDFPSRVMANYVARATAHREKADLYVRITEDAYKKYLFYTSSIKKADIGEIRKSFATHKHSIGNVTFISCLDMNKTNKPKNLTIYQSSLCQDVSLDTPFLRISRWTDGGEIYRIYNERFCSSHFSQKPYPSNFKLNQLAPETLTDQEFCETFVSR